MDFSMFGGGPPARNDLSQELALNLDKRSQYLRMMKRIKVKFTASKAVRTMNDRMPDQSFSINES